MGYIKEAFDTNWIAPLGPQVDAFESEMAQYIKCRTLALSSGDSSTSPGFAVAGGRAGGYSFLFLINLYWQCKPGSVFRSRAGFY